MQQETPLTETQQLRFSSRSRSNYGPTLALKEGIDINELTSKGKTNHTRYCVQWCLLKLSPYHYTFINRNIIATVVYLLI